MVGLLRQKMLDGITPPNPPGHIAGAFLGRTTRFVLLSLPTRGGYPGALQKVLGR